MPPERLLELVDEAKALGVREWRISGLGEPTLHPGCLPMMYRIKESGMSGQIVTNGTLISSVAIKRLVERGWDEVWISLDGPTAEIHDGFRGAGTFSRVCRLLGEFQRVKERFDSPLPRLTLTSILSRPNAGAIPELFELADRFGCDNVVLNELEVRTPYAREHALSGAELARFTESLRKLQNHPKWADSAVNVPGLGHTVEEIEVDSNPCVQDRGEIIRPGNATQGRPDMDMLKYSCFEPWYSLQIFPDGKISLCCVTPPSQDAPICSSVSLEDVWFGPYFTEVRKRIASIQFLPQCEVCNAGQQNEIKKLRSQLLRSAQVVSYVQ